MALCNGVEGIGTGWSSYIPNYNPRDIVENLKRWIHWRFEGQGYNELGDPEEFPLDPKESITTRNE